MALQNRFVVGLIKVASKVRLHLTGLDALACTPGELSRREPLTQRVVAVAVAHSVLCGSGFKWADQSSNPEGRRHCCASLDTCQPVMGLVAAQCNFLTSHPSPQPLSTIKWPFND